MAIPSQAELRNWVENYIALWNAHDKDAWLANWRKVAPGDVFMLDPVGTPEKRGGEECWSESWELFNERVRFKIAPGRVGRTSRVFADSAD